MVDFSWKALKHALDVTTCVVLIVAGSAFVWKQWRGGSADSSLMPISAIPPPLTGQVSVEGRASEGSPTASVVMVEFSDFECPFCVRFAREVLPALRSEYIQSGKVRLVFRHLPLVKVHPLAMTAATYAECATTSKRFWEVHDALFARPGAGLTETVLAEGLRRAGLSPATCDAKRTQAEQAVRDDIAMASKMRVTSTPAFLIGEAVGSDLVNVSRSVQGAKGMEVFRKELDALLK